MHTLRRWIIMVGILAGLLLPAAASAAPVISVQPPVGPAGTQFLFFANGFKARERIYIWLNTPDGRVQAVSQPLATRSSTYGDASWTWTAPDSAQSGAWQMVAHGHDSGIEQVIPFTIGTPASADDGKAFNVTPTSGVPGTLFRFFATGYNARELLDITVQGPGGMLKDPVIVKPGATTDEGRVDGSWAAPFDAAPGAWQIIVRGVDSHVERIMPVTITPAASGTAPTLQMTVQPASGAPGSRFIFSATGLYPNEDLSLWLNTPDGHVMDATIEGTSKTAPDGRAGWTWVAPADAQRGTWQMVAHGRKGGSEVVATFTIQ